MSFVFRSVFILKFPLCLSFQLHSEYRSTYRWHEYTGNNRAEVIKKPPATNQFGKLIINVYMSHSFVSSFFFNFSHFNIRWMVDGSVWDFWWLCCRAQAKNNEIRNRFVVSVSVDVLENFKIGKVVGSSIFTSNFPLYDKDFVH